MILHIDTAYQILKDGKKCLWKERRRIGLDGVKKGRVSQFLFIMSFGQHSYQHRYFKDGGRNRTILSPLSRNSPLPLSIPRTYQSIQPVYYSPIKPQNPIIYTNPISQYHPPIYDEYNDYVYNSILLDNYKKSADYYRKYRRFGSVNDYYDSLPPVRRVRTEVPYVQPIIPASPVVYINKDNPEVLVHLQKHNDVLASRIKEVEKEKERMHSEVLMEKQQARGYKRKYDKLKNRLRDEIADRRVREMELRQRRELELQRQQEKVEQIQQAMLEMSRQLNNNSKILEENIKLKEDLQHQKEKERVMLFPAVPTVLTRSILMDRPKLDSQYRQMYRLKRQISDLDRKLCHSFKY